MSARIFYSFNPATAERLEAYEYIEPQALAQKIESSFKAFLHWSNRSVTERVTILKNLSALLSEKKDELARLASLEMGKPIRQARAEVEKCAWVCDYYAENAENFMRSENVLAHARIDYCPLGPVLAIMPWNFPYWQVFRFLAPNLAAGNTVLLKHASNVPACAQAIEDLVIEAGSGLPLLQNLYLEASRVEECISDFRVRALSFTGSTEAGRKLASLSGKYLKKSVLELGGSDPYIIFGDAQIETAAKLCAESRLINSGQSCIAAKRFIIVRERVDEFVECFQNELFRPKVGNPLEEDTEIGPLAKLEVARDLALQVKQSAEMGAEIRSKFVPERNSCFYPPQLVLKIKKGMRIYEEECFGPVAAIIEAKDEETALELANDSAFGLGAAIFSQDIERAKQLASQRIQSGTCFINNFVKSDPQLPFGGIKDSGYGRELGLAGIREFVNIKTISWKTEHGPKKQNRTGK